MDKADLAKLTKYAKVFADARERDANESDTVMYLIEFLKRCSATAAWEGLFPGIPQLKCLEA